MIKKITFLLFCFVLDSWAYPASWVDIYKKGDIVLKADPSFGSKTDWAGIFYNDNKQIAVAPDLCVFVSDLTQNKIYKFDKNGALIKTFSQTGCGPGDTLGPSDLSIMNGQYLVVRESSEINRRVSIFGLDCKFIESIRANSFILKATALKDNKIAYLIQNSKPDEYEYFSVLIVDFRTKQTFPVVTFKQKMKRTIFQESSFDGEVFISQINGGDLLVGYSEDPYLSIYSERGEKKYSINLKITPIKVTTAMKNEVKKMIEEQAKRQPILRQYMKQLDLDKMFSEYVPLYRRIMVDADDDILVVKHTGFYIKNTLDFQVYSKSGQYCNDSHFQFGEFKSDVRVPISFQKNAIYCILEKEEEDDALIRIVKVNVK
jgi:hypothetical protein